ncbi:hypothetical protein ENBRE01_0950 [Enteropsectra breve]|nr:hypothetical protein ENBRE01_0950 [Enteropsectra breve]
MSAASEYICSEVKFPICKVLELNEAKYGSDASDALGVNMESPYTLALIAISILCGIRMIMHVNSLYASIGRGEMRTIFSIYIISNVLQFILVGFPKDIEAQLYLFLTVIQVSLNSTLFFSLLLSSITITWIYGIFNMKSSTFMRVLSIVYLGIISSVVFVSVAAGNDTILPILFIINAASMLLYIIIQSKKLKKRNGEIWSFGVLAVTAAFFMLSVLHTLFGSQIVGNLSSRNIDSLFMINLYTLIVLMMVHKYWLSTCDFELECLALEA